MVRNPIGKPLYAAAAVCLAIAAGLIVPQRPDEAASLSFLGYTDPPQNLMAGALIRFSDEDRQRRLARGVLSSPLCLKPSAIAVDTPDNRLFMACAGGAALAVFDLGSGLPVAMLPVGDEPRSIAYDPVLHRLYVVGEEGVLTVIAQSDADSYRLLDSFRLHRDARTLSLDPATHRLYVACTGLLARRRTAAFAAKPL